MLSSNINLDGDDGDDEEPDMPGDYEPWPRVTSNTAPPRPAPPPRTAMRSPPRTRRRSPPVPPKSRPPVRTAPAPVKSRRPRSRPLTPDIVIDRRHGHSHHHHHHRTSSRNRVITIPLDNRPTLGLRGLPRQVLEIERVRCRRRRRRCQPRCYEIEYYDQPQPMQSQPNVMFVNPTSAPQVQPSFPSSANHSSASLALLSTLTPEIIENLPKKTVHLPPIHLPGSRADATTKLHTVMFPAELINPSDGTLSIIQSNSASQPAGFPNAPYPVSPPVQPQLINTSINNESPLAPLATLSGPFMEQVYDLVQRINLSQAQPTSPYATQNTVQPYSPTMPPYNVQTVPSNYPLNTGPYPAANIRSTAPSNIGPYNPSNVVASSSAGATPYQQANITPYSVFTNATSNLPNTSLYRPANITPYHGAVNIPYNSTNITSYQPASARAFNSENIAPYQPANITPYQPTRSAPSYLTKTRPSYAGNNAPTNVSNDGPYGPANITPYNLHSAAISMQPLSDQYGVPTPISSSSLNSYLYDTNNGSTTIAYSPQSRLQPSNRTGTTMPKSILRNASSNRF